MAIRSRRDSALREGAFIALKSSLPGRSSEMIVTKSIMSCLSFSGSLTGIPGSSSAADDYIVSRIIYKILLKPIQTFYHLISSNRILSSFCVRSSSSSRMDKYSDSLSTKPPSDMISGAYFHTSMRLSP